MSYATKKFVGVTDYNSIWRGKSRLVAGKEFEDRLWIKETKWLYFAISLIYSFSQLFD